MPKCLKFSAKFLVEKFKFGFVNLVKPSGITSHDLVNAVRKITGIKQVGHSGTLDPMACGVMILGLSKACRLIQFLGSDKTYCADILLGTQTDTDDIEGATLAQCPPDKVANLSATDIGSALSTFVGKIEQIPPAYSAIKINGVKMYEIARKGQVLAPEAVKPRHVEVSSIQIINIDLPVISVRIDCSSGTYIRSIARDLGNMLGVGGCLNKLVRERIGSFNLEQSLNLDQFKAKWQKEENDCITPLDKALPIPVREMENTLLLKLVNGQILENIDNYPEMFLAKLLGSSEHICLVSVKEGKMKAQVVLLSQGQF